MTAALEEPGAAHLPDESWWDRARSGLTALPRAWMSAARFVRAPDGRDADERYHDQGLPAPRRDLRAGLHAFLDHLVLTGFEAGRRMGPPQEWERYDRELDVLLAAQTTNGVARDPAAYHPEPLPAAPSEAREVRSFGTTFSEVRFGSEWSPPAGEPGVARWAGWDANQQVPVRLLEHEGAPRPWLICVHGAEQGGRPGLDARMFRALRMHRELGLNVALPVLPLHGPRRQGVPRRVRFPDLDPVTNLHAAAQGVWDQRRLVRWLREKTDHPIGMLGFSLGGYVASMVAPFEALDVVVVQCAPTSLARLLDANLPEGADGVDSVRAMLERAEVAWRPVNPTELPAPVDGAPRFILGGLCDRLAHPVDHGAELWQHWGRPPAHWYHGSHLVSRGAPGVAEFIDDALRQTLLAA